MKHVLISGGLGFIGINYLLDKTKEHEDVLFVVLDKLTYAANDPKIIKDLKNVTLVRGDICSKKTVFSLFKKYHFELVINFAAETHVDNSLTNPLIFTKTNVYGLNVLLEASKKYGVKKFHQVSTDEVYGESLGHYFKETDALNPSSPYAASKAAGDLLCLSYMRSYNMNISITRSSNNYGKYQNIEKFMPKVINNLLEKKMVPIYGDGKNLRDYLYVKDNCNLIDLIAFDPKLNGIYNISSHQEYSAIEIAESICKCLGSDLNLIKFVKDRKGHDFSYKMDTSKIESLFSYKFQEFNIDQYIQEVINEHIKSI